MRVSKDVHNCNHAVECADLDTMVSMSRVIALTRVKCRIRYIVGLWFLVHVVCVLPWLLLISDPCFVVAWLLASFLFHTCLICLVVHGGVVVTAPRVGRLSCSAFTCCFSFLFTAFLYVSHGLLFLGGGPFHD